MNQKNLKRKVPKSGLISNSKRRKVTESKRSELEELFLRFPLMARLILINLNDQTLVQFNKISKELYKNDTKERLVWIRIIKKYASSFQDVHEAWKEIVHKTPNGYLEKLAKSIQEFSKSIILQMYKKEKKWFPIQIAVEQGSLELCQFIVEKTGNRRPTGGYWGPLNLAAKMGNLEIFKLISGDLEDINQGCDFNWTPLHTAVCSGKYEMCQYIISNVKDKNPKTENGKTVLHWAAMVGHLNIFKLIIENTSDKNPAIIHPGCPDDGKTPLHMAADNERLDICRILTTNATDKNPSDARGWTPLHYAATRGNLKMCHLFLSYVDEQNPVTLSGKTPKDFARDKNIRKLFGP